MSYTVNAQIMADSIVLATSYLDDEQAETVTNLFPVWESGIAYIVDDRIDAAYYLAKKTRSGEVIDEKQDFIIIYWHAGSFYIKTDLSWPYTVMRSSITSTKANNITCTDNGLIGSTIDATALLFMGGQDIVAGTMTSKDSTLFLWHYP